MLVLVVVVCGVLTLIVMHLLVRVKRVEAGVDRRRH